MRKERFMSQPEDKHGSDSKTDGRRRESDEAAARPAEPDPEGGPSRRHQEFLSERLAKLRPRDHEADEAAARQRRLREFRARQRRKIEATSAALHTLTPTAPADEAAPVDAPSPEDPDGREEKP